MGPVIVTNAGAISHRYLVQPADDQSRLQVDAPAAVARRTTSRSADLKSA